jgi:hypothetical protein
MDMSSTTTITVKINGRERTVSASVETETQLLSEAGFPPSEYRLYWDDLPLADRGEDHRVGQSITLEDGDRLVAIPLSRQ